MNSSIVPKRNLLSLFLLISLSCGSLSPLFAMTIAEKKAALKTVGKDFDASTEQKLEMVNTQIKANFEDLQELYKEALEAHQRGEPPETFVELRDKILNIREQITATESGWRSLLVERGGEGGYALWNLPETTIEQLILDFGSQDFAYVFSSEIANRTFSINSHIAIPRSAWSEVLELILNQQGIGIRTLNPFLKELYDLKNDASGLTLITSERLDLEMIDPNDRIGFVLTPESTSISQITRFLERFVNPLTVGIDVFSRNLFVTALAREMREVLKLYDFAVNNRTDYQYKLIALRKVDADEMAQVLEALFESIEEKTTEENATTSTTSPSPPSIPSTSLAKLAPPSRTSDKAKTRPTQKSNSKKLTGTGLRIIPLQDVARAIFLVGTADEIAKAERVIQEVENQVNQAHGQVLFSYRVKHSDPEQLGQVLDKIYQLFLVERSSRPGEEGDAARKEQGQRPDSSSQSFSLSLNQPTQQKQDLFSTGLDDTQGFYLGGNNAIGGNLDSARPVQPAEVKQKEFNKGRSNFLIDPSTNIMIMVVEPDILPRLRDLIKKIDVPRKMVKIDVLLFEKRVATTEEMGLNLFRIGGKASDTKLTSAVWNDRAVTGQNAADTERDLVGQGILSFFLSRTRGHGVPAYDMAYRFLMSLQDVTINANPSVVTVNQLPAYIAIVEELSINTGVVEISSAGGPQSKDSFTRAQYGTIIKVTPTIHMKDVEDHSSWGDDVPDYISLETDVTFDTVQRTLRGTVSSRPEVIRRNIKNYTCVPDGKTIILGGLRRKDIGDGRDAIPFLGEIPYLGRCFSNTSINDNGTEMFVFITPSIVSEPCEDFERIRREQLDRRPGDIPEFLCLLEEARCRERHRCYAQGMRMLLGRTPERCVKWGDDICRYPHPNRIDTRHNHNQSWRGCHGR